MLKIQDGPGSSKRSSSLDHNSARRTAKARQRAEKIARANAKKVAEESRMMRRINDEINHAPMGNRRPLPEATVEVAIVASDTHAFLANVPASWIRS